MFLSVLGRLRAEVDEVEVPVPAGMQRLLLAALAQRVRRPVSITTLSETLWDDESPSRPDKALQLYVHRLRRLLGETRVQHGPAGYTLVAARAELDWQCFEDLLRAARESRHARDWPGAARRYTEALALWRSEPYEDVSASRLLAPEIGRLTALRVEARVEQAEVLVECGEHTKVEPLINSLLARFPHREQLYGLLMLVRYRAGRVGDALEVYRCAQRVLSEQLGVEPGPKLRRIHRAVLNRSPRLDGDAPPVAVVVPAQLPVAVTQLSGRVEELRLLTAETVGPQPVTVRAVDGMAGVGKSALAIHAAHRLASRYPDGQLFADLCGATPGMSPSPPVEVLGRLLESLGVTGDRLPRDPQARSGLWRSVLRGKRMLILLDNAADSKQLRPLLPGHSGSLVLVTSRDRLTELDDVWSLSLNPLPTDDGVRLFGNVAGTDRLTDAASLAEVVAACGGLPLALRLTAARFRDRPSWNLEQLAQRLRRDRPELLSREQHGVAAAFAVAYERLPDDQRRLFRRLSLHPGQEFCAASAAAIAATDDAENDLEALVDRHLLQSPRFGRYRFHDLMRRYAERLTDEDDTDAERTAALARGFDHYVRATVAAVTAADFAPSLRPRGCGLFADVPLSHSDSSGDDSVKAAEWLDTELSNLVAVANRAAAAGRAGHVVALSWQLARYLSAAARTDEESILHRLADRVAADSGDPVARALTRYHLGTTSMAVGDRDTALECHAEALETFQDTGDVAAQSLLHHAMANVLDFADRLTQSLRHRQRALELAEALGDLPARCRTHLGLAISLRRMERHAESRHHGQRALETAIAARHTVYQASAHEQLGNADLLDGDDAAAREHFERSLQLYRSGGNRRGEYQALNGLGRALAVLGQTDDALERQREALDVVRDIDDPNAKLEGHLWLGDALVTAGQPDDARRHVVIALDLARRLRQPQEEQDCLRVLDRLP